ncbi:hypothetical protein [Streptomyces sp. R41]|uniref:Uncharacterized protein n=1 Tax=Streptomyces sp. R41 TaxID=3238632 RepID=A0AB39RBG6_9ACTN
MHSRACASYEAQCAGSNEIVAAASLDDVGHHPDCRSGNANLRWMLIVRELLDGAKGYY